LYLFFHSFQTQFQNISKYNQHSLALLKFETKFKVVLKNDADEHGKQKLTCDIETEREEVKSSKEIIITFVNNKRTHFRVQGIT